MIKFFRKIRKNFLSEDSPDSQAGNTRKSASAARSNGFLSGRTGRYLKYAVGEIMLVMIGILLALQVNNWNELRKTKNNERKLLQAMLVDLKTDSLQYARSMSSQRSVEQLHLQLFEESRDPSLIKDTLKIDKLRRGILFFSTFLQHQTKNILMVSKDSLREDLSNFINRITTTENAKNTYTDYLDVHLKPYFARHGIHRIEAMFNTNGYTNLNANGRLDNYVNYQKLQRQYGTIAFEEHLFALAMRNRWYMIRLENIIEWNEQIRTKIKHELEKEF